MPSQNSFGAAGELRAGGRTYSIYRLAALEKAGIANLSRIPFSIKILLENLLRHEDGSTVKRSDIEFVARWDTTAEAREINFSRSTRTPVTSSVMREAHRGMWIDGVHLKSGDPAVVPSAR